MKHWSGWMWCQYKDSHRNSDQNKSHLFHLNRKDRLYAVPLCGDLGLGGRMVRITDLEPRKVTPTSSPNRKRYCKSCLKKEEKLEG